MRRSRAFTLIEMLVAMAMIAVLAGSLYASMRIAFGARRTAEAAVEPLAAVESVFEALGRDLSCAPPPRGILAGPCAGTDGSDDMSGLPSDTIDFFTRPACSPGTAPGIVRVSYGLTDAEGRRAVARRLTVNLLAPEEQQPEEEILCDNVLALNFRYFDGADWYDTWDSTAAGDSLPVAVEATVVLEVPGREEGEEFRRIFTLEQAGGG